MEFTLITDEPRITKRASFTLSDMFDKHASEHLRVNADAKAARRQGYSAKPVLEFFGNDFDPTKFKQRVFPFQVNVELFSNYIEKRLADGMALSSIRRELCMLQAAYNHSASRGRLEGSLKIKMPPKGRARRRVWTEEEAKRLMDTKMPRRVFLFYLVAFATGARSEAIEQLTWNRVMFDQRIVDFNVPGQRVTNKRRARTAMAKSFIEDLRKVYEDRDPSDPYVIGAGKYGKPTPTYKACAKVVEAAGLKEGGVCRHITRKCYVSWRYQRGKDLAKIAASIADSPATTASNYAFLEAEHMRDVVELEPA